MRNKLIVIIIVSFLSFFNVLQSAYANDSAAGWAATGLYLKQEKNISIEEEVLYINANKVVVSYIFKNHSDKDISTEVAFPMPAYEYTVSENGKPDPIYDDFTVEINGTRIKYQEDVRALVKNKDYTKLLNEMGISIDDFADVDSYFKHGYRFDDPHRPKYFFEKLTSDQQRILVKNKLVYQEQGLKEYPLPNWSVSRRYYWTQVFPARSTISIKHSYKPYKGYDYLGGNKPVNDACINSDLKQRLASSPRGPRYFTYVDYILTTANSWKQPIKSFHLIIDGKDEYNQEPSMCFDNKLERKGPFRYEVTVQNFKPKNDITVYFFYWF